MIVKIVPTTEQIIFSVKAALGSFETLDHDPNLAIEVACMHLKQLLEYLGAVNRANNVHAEFGPGRTEPAIMLKGFIGDNGRVD